MTTGAHLLVLGPGVVVAGIVIWWRRKLSGGLHPRMIDLARASNRDSAHLILQSWTQTDTSRARKLLLLDFVLLIAYGAAGVSLTSLVGERAKWSNGSAQAGKMIVAMAASEAIASVASLLMIARRRVGKVLPAITAFFSFAKSGLRGLIALYLGALLLYFEVRGLMSVVWWIIRKVVV